MLLDANSYRNVDIRNVYIDSNMKDYALPISEATSNLGFGVLTRGSRISIGK